MNNGPDNDGNNDSLLLPLKDDQHVVLGRYNGKKTKPLTTATEIYKNEVRTDIPTTKNVTDSDIRKLKNKMSELVPAEMPHSQPPEISFWVDATVAEKAGVLAKLLHVHPQMRTCLDFDGEEVVLVQDNNFFLKQDLAWKRRNPRSTKKVSSAKKTKSDRCQRTAGDGKKLAGGEEPANVAGSVSSTAASGSAASSKGNCVAASKAAPNTSRFQIVDTSSTPLDEQVKRLGDKWIAEDPRGEIQDRRRSMVLTLKSILNQYSSTLKKISLLKNARMQDELSGMHEAMLVPVANTLGNSMIDWCERYPTTCLSGERNEWMEERQQERDGSDTADAARQPLPLADDEAHNLDDLVSFDVDIQTSECEGESPTAQSDERIGSLNQQQAADAEIQLASEQDFPPLGAPLFNDDTQPYRESASLWLHQLFDGTKKKRAARPATAEETPTGSHAPSKKMRNLKRNALLNGKLQNQSAGQRIRSEGAKMLDSLVASKIRTEKISVPKRNTMLSQLKN